MRRDDVASTSVRRHFNVICPLGCFPGRHSPSKHFLSSGRKCTFVSNGRKCTFVSIGRKCTFVSNGRKCTFVSIGRKCSFVSIGRKCTFVSNGRKCTFVSNGRKYTNTRSFRTKQKRHQKLVSKYKVSLYTVVSIVRQIGTIVDIL